VRDLKSGESLYILAIDIPKYKNDFRFEADPTICFVKGVVTHTRPAGNQSTLRFVDFDNSTMDVSVTFVNSNCYIRCPNFGKLLRSRDFSLYYQSDPEDIGSPPISNYIGLPPAPPMSLTSIRTGEFNTSTILSNEEDVTDPLFTFEITDNPILDNEQTMIDENAEFFDACASNVTGQGQRKKKRRRN